MECSPMDQPRDETEDETEDDKESRRGGRSITAIHVSLATKMPMRSMQSVEVKTQHGIVGDRYEGSRHRQVSVQSIGELDASSEALGSTIDPGLTRRNITISGGPLDHTPGALINVGDVQLEVVRTAAPCRIMDFEIGDGARAAMRRRGGVICRVLSGGTVSVGDPADA